MGAPAAAGGDAAPACSGPLRRSSWRLTSCLSWLGLEPRQEKALIVHPFAAFALLPWRSTSSERPPAGGARSCCDCRTSGGLPAALRGRRARAKARAGLLQTLTLASHRPSAVSRVRSCEEAHATLLSGRPTPSADPGRSAPPAPAAPRLAVTLDPSRRVASHPWLLPRLLSLHFSPGSSAACPLSRNTSLLSPFLLDYPSSLSHTLDDSASCISFNPTGYFAGSFVAVGRTDGCISIWDVLTHDVVWVETGHAKQVESVSWSRNSRYLLSASRDGTAIVWDLERSARVETVRFSSPVVNAQFHPGNAQIFVATLATGQVIVVDLRPGSRGQRQIVDPGEGLGAAAVVADEQVSGKGKQRATTDGGATPASLTFARFNPSGRRLYVGTKKGELLILDSYSHEVGPRSGCLLPAGASY
jgi:hypothetical protein